MSNLLSEIAIAFGIDVDLKSYGNGHINDTYIINGNPKYILQRINTAIFKHPEEVMHNIVGVTEHLREKLLRSGGDAQRGTLTVVRTVDGRSFYRDRDGSCFRMYHYIENSVGYEQVECREQLYEAARAFGRFQRMLEDYPTESLFETIPKFHDTESRLADFRQAVLDDRMGRRASVEREIEFILSRAADATVILDGIKAGRIPLRVTHNDTKLNNVLFDAKTGKGLCVIDLDTVMTGSLLYDFGDALRFGASTGAEDETDLDKIHFDLDLFDAFTQGFLEELGDVLTPAEAELLPFSAKLMTYECGMRFLGDYLNGDTYFKIHREHHNLDRARTQIKLVADIETKLDAMREIVQKYL